MARTRSRQAKTSSIKYAGRRDLEEGDWVKDEDGNWYRVQAMDRGVATLEPLDRPDAWQCVVELRQCVQDVLAHGRKVRLVVDGTTDGWTDRGEDCPTGIRNLYVNCDNGWIWIWRPLRKSKGCLVGIRDNARARQLDAAMHRFHLEYAAQHFRWPKIIRLAAAGSAVSKSLRRIRLHIQAD